MTTVEAWKAAVRSAFPRVPIEFFTAPSGWRNAHARRRPTEPITLVATLSPQGEVWIAK